MFKQIIYTIGLILCINFAYAQDVDNNPDTTGYTKIFPTFCGIKMGEEYKVYAEKFKQLEYNLVSTDIDKINSNVILYAYIGVYLGDTCEIYLYSYKSKIASIVVMFPSSIDPDAKRVEIMSLLSTKYKSNGYNMSLENNKQFISHDECLIVTDITDENILQLSYILKSLMNTSVEESNDLKMNQL